MEKWKKIHTFAGRIKIFMVQTAEIKSYLVDKLKQGNWLWSYDQSSLKDIPDDVLIEFVMLYLDIDEINALFRIYPYEKVKRAWLENCVAQGERYYNLNTFLAWYYFRSKQPQRYVKAMTTRMLNKKLSV